MDDRSILRGVVAAAIGLAALATTPAAANAAAKPDLEVIALSGAPATAQPGAKLTLLATTQNAGTAAAKASATRAYLSGDGKLDKRDVRLDGSLTVKALTKGKRVSGRLRVTLPATVAPGAYRLLVCADDRKTVKERSETNNCKASGSLRIAAPAPAAATPTPTPTPAAAPLVQAQSAPGTDAPVLSGTTPVSPARDDHPVVHAKAAAGAILRVYLGAGCTGAVVAVGLAGGDGTGDLSVPVPKNTAAAIGATATLDGHSASTCSDPLTYVEDETPPAVSITGTDPASPSNSLTPTLKGTTEAGATVAVFTTADCSGAAVATGVAAGGAFAIGVVAPPNAFTTYRVIATDALGNASSCSSPFGYATDITAPQGPAGLAFTPVSGGASNAPKLTGTAEPGSVVQLFADATCTGLPTIATAAVFAAAGITVHVDDLATSAFGVRVVDAAGNASTCAAVPTYTVDPHEPNDSPSTATGPYTGDALVRGALIGTNDDDYVAVTVAGGARFTAATYAPALGPGVACGKVLDTELDLFAPDGTTLLATNDDIAGSANRCSAVTSGVLAAGTYYVKVQSYNHEEAFNAYGVQLTFLPVAAITGSTPASPGPSTSPLLIGSATAGSTVSLFTTPTCTGTPVATGSAATFAAPGLGVTVAAKSSMTFYAQATLGTKTPTCSAGFTYQSLLAPPVLTSSSPATPSTNTKPALVGTVTAGSTVSIYTSAACTGTSTSGSAAAFTSTGIQVPELVNLGTHTTFYAQATKDGGISACSGGFTYLAAPVQAEVEPNDSVATATQMTGEFGQGVTGASGDVDYYRFTVSTARSYRLDVTNAGGADCVGITSAVIRLYSGNGTLLYSDNPVACHEQTVYLAAGTYSASVSSSTTAAYVLRVQPLDDSVAEKEPNETPVAATYLGFLVKPKVVVGDHSVFSDTDWYAFNVSAGMSLDIELYEGGATTCESNAIDSQLTLLGPDGTQLVDDDDDGRGLCSRIHGIGPLKDAGAANLPDGTYFLQVRASPLAAGSSGLFSYRVAIVPE